MIPASVNQLIKDYQDMLHEKLPNTIEGIYLHGSIALNSFGNSSDIDFLTITKRPLIDEDIQALKQIHQMIAEKYVMPEMDGMYMQLIDIGKNTEAFNTPFYNGGEMHAAGAFNQNPITWWTLKHYGIRISGPAIEELKIEVTPEDLKRYVHANMNAYWKSRVESFKTLHFTAMSDDLIEEEIEWSVLGVLRQFYTLKEQDITSKLGAGKYAMNHLPKEWGKIIQEAIRIREKTKITSYQSNEEKVSDAIHFLTFVIQYCNDLVEEGLDVL
ncbi:MAG: aminoglycoside adenylyltransferase domain-containing protein [Heyndrickxia sp.]